MLPWLWSCKRLTASRKQVAKGGAVEVESAGEWWEATISKVRDDKIKVHYVGGTEDEDEWIQLKRCAAEPTHPPVPSSARTLHSHAHSHATMRLSLDIATLPHDSPSARSPTSAAGFVFPRRTLRQPKSAAGWPATKPQIPSRSRRASHSKGRP